MTIDPSTLDGPRSVAQAANSALALPGQPAAIAAAAGHPVPAAALAATTSTITQEGSAFVPSMYRDLSEGLPVEVEHVLGDLVARAARPGVPAPLLNLATTNLRIYENRL